MSLPSLTQCRDAVIKRLLGGVPRPAGTGPRRDYLSISVLSALAILATLMLVRLVINISYPYPIDNGEGCVLDTAWHASKGIPIYGLIHSPPYHFTVYTPLFPYLGGLLMYLFGPTPYAFRITSAVFFIGAVFLVYLFVRRETRLWTAGLVAALFLFVERSFVMRSGYAVTDFPAIFFSLLGLYLWIRGGASRYWAVVAFTAAFFSKQSAVLAPAAAFLSLFLQGKRRSTVALAGAYCALMAAGFGICHLLFGEAFFVNAFQYAGVAHFNKRWAVTRVEDFMLANFAPVAAWLVFATMAWHRKRLLLPVLYVFFGFLASFSVGRVGASRSYFFDFAAGLSLIVGLLWPSVVAQTKMRAAATLTIAVTAAQIVAIMTGVWLGHWRLGDRTPVDLEHDAAISEAYMNNTGTVLCRDQGFAVAARADSLAIDMFKLWQLVQAGVVPREVFLRPVRNHEFPMIVMLNYDDKGKLFTGYLREAVIKYYRLAYVKHDNFYMIPREDDSS